MEPFFFLRGGRRLFGLYFPPAAAPNRKGALFCNAFGKEFEICRTPIARFARDLNARGWACLRFDYHGYGDSEGDFGEATLTSMQEDAEAAIAELRARAPIAELALIGIRLGATVAALTAARRADIAALALWEPAVRPYDYLAETLRHNISMQSMIFKDVALTREQIIENTLAGRPSLAGGYDLNTIDEGFPLGAGLLREARQLDLGDRPLAARTLIVNVARKLQPLAPRLKQYADKLAAQGTPCRAEVAVEATPPWVHERTWIDRSPDVFAKTLAFLEG